MLPVFSKVLELPNNLLCWESTTQLGLCLSAKVVRTNYQLRPDIVSEDQINLPRWHDAELSSPQCVHLAYCADQAAVTWLRSWDSQVIIEIRLVDCHLGLIGEALATDLISASVATRLVLCGPEAFVAPTASVARRLGVKDSELILLVLDSQKAGTVDEGTRLRRLFCVHCRSLFGAEASIGDLVVCPTCAAHNVIHYSYSRRLAAYMAQPVGSSGFSTLDDVA